MIIPLRQPAQRRGHRVKTFWVDLIFGVDAPSTVRYAELWLGFRTRSGIPGEVRFGSRPQNTPYTAGRAGRSMGTAGLPWRARFAEGGATWRSNTMVILEGAL
jgi:hypothetical protein